MYILQTFFVLFAIALAWEGIKGLRGVVDKKGKSTSRGLAIALCIIAGVLVVSAFTVLPALMQ